ncbi:MAG: 3',5'-cyclic-nucleotide phosphodiesterase [Syntrophobacter sp.]
MAVYPLHGVLPLLASGITLEVVHMNIRVLGSSGSEGPGNNTPAFLIDDFLLMDAGTIAPSLDRAEQCRITHIFLTHAHLDHIKGIPFLVDNLVAMNQSRGVQILSGKDVLSDLKRNVFNNRIWPDFTLIPNGNSPVMLYQPISTRIPVLAGRYTITAVKVNHTVPAYGYLIEEPSRGTLVYTGDTGPTEMIWKKMRTHTVRKLIIEVSFPDEMNDLALATGHLTPSLLAREIKKMRTIPETIYIGHLKPFYRNAIEAQLARIPGANLQVLRDGERFKL